jgi:hypothetical protein
MSSILGNEDRENSAIMLPITRAVQIRGDIRDVAEDWNLGKEDEIAGVPTGCIRP